MRASRVLILIACLAVPLQGCGVFAYDVSVPSAIPPGVEGRIVDGDALHLTLPSLHVWMQVRNHTSSTTPTPKNLGILLWIESNRSTKRFPLILGMWSLSSRMARWCSWRVTVDPIYYV